jgi:hypothetical protein
MSESDDSWPNYSTAGKEYLHALGIITLNFNKFESAIFRLFSHHLERMNVASGSAGVFIACSKTPKGL